jgi:outer membrane protein assembly factor BamD
MRRFSLILVACAVSLLMAACSVRKPPTGEDYYQQAQLNFSNREYNAAIENYQYVVDKFPFSPYAEDAEMKIGLAYYKEGEYAQAIAALDDFQRMHPTSKNLQLVSYYIASSYFDQIGREDQDQSKTEMALSRFQMLEQRFPESEFAELAKEKSQICREVLARHEKVVGDFYYSRANFRAAESRLAELMQKYPDTPIAPDALWELGTALEKEGKKYSAAQAYAAMVQHYPNTKYAKQAREKLARLKQPIDNEEDPLKLVLAENGYGETVSDGTDGITVRQKVSGPEAAAAPASAPAYGEDGLPILDRPAEATPAAAKSSSGPARLKTIRLATSNPPMSVILDLTGPVKFEKHLESGPGYSTVKVLLRNVTPDASIQHHLVFDRSIFKDCDISSDSQGTVVTLNTEPVSSASVVPLSEPPRLLVAFTPQNNASAF